MSWGVRVSGSLGVSVSQGIRECNVVSVRREQEWIGSWGIPLRIYEGVSRRTVDRATVT